MGRTTTSLLPQKNFFKCLELVSGGTHVPELDPNTLGVSTCFRMELLAGAYVRTSDLFFFSVDCHKVSVKYNYQVPRTNRPFRGQGCHL